VSRVLRVGARIWHAAARGLEILTTTLFALLLLVVLWGVLSRYWPGITPSDWTEELGIYLLVWVSLLGSALTFRIRGHLGVDYFVTRFDPAARHLAGIAIEMAVLVFAVFGLCYGGWRLMADTLGAGQLTPVLQWRVGYFYAAVPLSGVFFVGFAIEHLLERPDPSSIGVSAGRLTCPS
jgi:TRAP-type C4-dicarboxylate transport system permease small subunit